MKVKALCGFYDRKEKVNRKAGEVFEASAARVAELNACGPEQCGKPLVAEVRSRKKAAE